MNSTQSYQHEFRRILFDSDVVLSLTMNKKELQSFIFKFHQLWEAGLTAHLDLDTHAGQAWVGLRVQLGQAHGGPVHQRQPSSHRSPAYHRRQERRKAAKAAASNCVSNIAEEAVGTSEAAKDTTEIVVIEVSNKNVEPYAENIESTENAEIAEKLVIDAKHAEKAFL